MAMKPLTPKPPARARRSKDPVARGLEFFFGDKPTAKPKKKTAPTSPGTVRLRNSKPAPMPTPRERTYPRGVKPAPMPKVERNYGKPRSERTLPKQIGPKSKQNPSLNKKTPSTATPKPKAKKPTLDDFLLKGKRPPIKLKPGLKRPRGL
jgi:hypothetical protein